MEFQTKFSCGDEVWSIQDQKERKFIGCKFCGGTRIVFFRTPGKRVETEGECPKCHGGGGEYTWLPTKWHVSTSILTIGEVRVEHRCQDPNSYGDPIFNNCGPQKEKYKESYMCRETGIGSGSVHYVESLWATVTEARAECDRLNTERNKED